MPNLPESMVVVRGSRCTVAYARDASGRLNAADFLESEQVPEKDKARLLRQFELVANGHTTNREQFKKEQGNIYGFKSYQARVAAFFGKNGFLFLTHGFMKKKDKWPPTEIERAERIRTEHTAWLTPEKN
jgi:hypothetical protein